MYRPLLAYSSTVPVTVTTSPTSTGVLLLKTRMPSLVAGSVSAVWLWMKNPPNCPTSWKSPVTTPSTITFWLSNGLAAPVPCTSAMVRATGSGSGGGVTLPLLRGVGAPVEKSALLLSVSV